MRWRAMLWMQKLWRSSKVRFFGLIIWLLLFHALSKGSCGQNPHFRGMDTAFSVKHYAGTVTYGKDECVCVCFFFFLSCLLKIKLRNWWFHWEEQGHAFSRFDWDNAVVFKSLYCQSVSWRFESLWNNFCLLKNFPKRHFRSSKQAPHHCWFQNQEQCCWFDDGFVEVQSSLHSMVRGGEIGFVIFLKKKKKKKSCNLASSQTMRKRQKLLMISVCSIKCSIWACLRMWSE